jgi:hypothetical protein
VVLVRQQKGQQAEETLARFSDLLRAVLADMDAQSRWRASPSTSTLPIHRAVEVFRGFASNSMWISTCSTRPCLHGAAAAGREFHPSRRRPAIDAWGHQHRALMRCLHVACRMMAQLTPGAGGGLKLGLANTRARLNQLFELRAAEAGGAVVTLVLPFHVIDDRIVEAR